MLIDRNPESESSCSFNCYLYRGEYESEEWGGIVSIVAAPIVRSLVLEQKKQSNMEPNATSVT